MKRCNGGFDIDEDALQGGEQSEKAGWAGEDALVKRKSTGCGNVLPQYRVEGATATVALIRLMACTGVPYKLQR